MSKLNDVETIAPHPTPPQVGEGVLQGSSSLEKNMNRANLEGVGSIIPTPARSPQSLFPSSLKKKVAFTLAEVLITLGIIGIVAAMTIPNLISKHSKQTTATKLKKAYSTLSQVMIKSLDEYGPPSEFFSSGADVNGAKSEEYIKTAWLQYFTGVNVISDLRYYPILPDGFRTFKQLSGTSIRTDVYTAYPYGRVLFSTNDGIFYYMFFMNWQPATDEEGNTIEDKPVYASSVTVYVDMNGNKGQNTLGKDVFMFCIDTDKGEVVPGCTKDTNIIKNDCIKNGRGVACAAKIKKDGWRIADDYPW